MYYRLRFSHAVFYPRCPAAYPQHRVIEFLSGAHALRGHAHHSLAPAPTLRRTAYIESDNSSQAGRCECARTLSRLMPALMSKASIHPDQLVANCGLVLPRGLYLRIDRKLNTCKTVWSWVGQPCSKHATLSTPELISYAPARRSIAWTQIG
jgi:hypothetical protein